MCRRPPVSLRKNMIVTDERGTSEVHHHGFEILSACQVLVRRYAITVIAVLETFQQTGSCASNFFKLHQRAVIPVTTVELFEGSNTQYSFAVHG
jgi:hypothetical protein